MTFGQRSVALAGIAARLLGWRPDEFWRATPAELASALSDETASPVESDKLKQLMTLIPDKAG